MSSNQLKVLLLIINIQYNVVNSRSREQKFSRGGVPGWFHVFLAKISRGLYMGAFAIDVMLAFQISLRWGYFGQFHSVQGIPIADVWLSLRLNVITSLKSIINCQIKFTIKRFDN